MSSFGRLRNRWAHALRLQIRRADVVVNFGSTLINKHASKLGDEREWHCTLVIYWHCTRFLCPGGRVTAAPGPRAAVPDARSCCLTGSVCVCCDAVYTVCEQVFQAALDTHNTELSTVSGLLRAPLLAFLVHHSLLTTAMHSDHRSNASRS